MSTARFNTLANAAGSKSVPVDTVVDGSAKAWVNFNGTGTVAIRASFNVSSITDNGTGNYTVNFTNPLIDANYCVTGVASTNGVANGFLLGPGNIGRTTTSVNVLGYSTGNSLMDVEAMNTAIFR